MPTRVDASRKVRGPAGERATARLLVNPTVDDVLVEAMRVSAGEFATGQPLASPVPRVLRDFLVRMDVE
jgi:hypothetical protein